MTTTIHVRPAVAAADNAAWSPSWRGDQAFDETGQAEAGTRITWR